MRISRDISTLFFSFFLLLSFTMGSAIADSNTILTSYCEKKITTEHELKFECMGGTEPGVFTDTFNIAPKSRKNFDKINFLTDGLKNCTLTVVPVSGKIIFFNSAMVKYTPLDVVYSQSFSISNGTLKYRKTPIPRNTLYRESFAPKAEQNMFYTTEYDKPNGFVLKGNLPNLRLPSGYAVVVDIGSSEDFFLNIINFFHGYNYLSFLKDIPIRFVSAFPKSFNFSKDIELTFQNTYSQELFLNSFAIFGYLDKTIIDPKKFPNIKIQIKTVSPPKHLSRQMLIKKSYGDSIPMLTASKILKKIHDLEKLGVIIPEDIDPVKLGELFNLFELSSNSNGTFNNNTSKTTKDTKNDRKKLLLDLTKNEDFNNFGLRSVNIYCE